jgi:hypothetical protein
MAFSPRRSSSAWLLLSPAWWHASWSTGRTADGEKLAAASGTRPRIAGLTGQGQAWLPGAPDERGGAWFTAQTELRSRRAMSAQREWSPVRWNVTRLPTMRACVMRGSRTASRTDHRHMSVRARPRSSVRRAVRRRAGWHCARPRRAMGDLRLPVQHAVSGLPGYHHPHSCRVPQRT